MACSLLPISPPRRSLPSPASPSPPSPPSPFSLLGLYFYANPLVVEVVSKNWQDDYARKVEEYALLSIPEYWIVDFRALGGIAFIGKPKQPTFTVCYLDRDEYRQQQYRLGQAIASLCFSTLQLQLDNVLPR